MDNVLINAMARELQLPATRVREAYMRALQAVDWECDACGDQTAPETVTEEHGLDTVEFTACARCGARKD